VCLECGQKLSEHYCACKLYPDGLQPTKALALLVIKGYTHGWPRFEASFGGGKDPESLEDANKYLKPYGMRICLKSELHNESVDEALNRGDGTYKP
jgi:hypothetical protein